MSGHSKWHNIQQRKGKQDARRANEFTKAAKAITLAAQKGGGDMAINFSLRMAVEKAKGVGMSKDNIEKAIKRGTGELKEGLPMEEVMYEAFRPGGVAIIIKAVTDNKNRTTSDVKHILNVHGGSLGGTGSVAWMFELWGVIGVSKEYGVGSSGETVELALIEAGAEDIKQVGEEIEIKTKVENLQKVVNKLKEMRITPKESGIRWIAKEHISVSPEVETKLADFFSELEALDDVEDYFTNAE